MLEVEGRVLAFDVSYLPHDFVAELAAALVGVVEGPGERVARLCEEPLEHEWRFRPFTASAVVFEVVTHHDGRGRVEARAWGPPREVVLPFWRALRELGERAGVERCRANWSAPFPSAAVERLTRLAEREGG